MMSLTLWQKIAGCLAALFAVIAAINEYGDYKHGKGYDAAVADINAKAAVELAKHNQKALDVIAADNDASIERVRVEYITQTKTKEVIKYVDKYIEVPTDCEPLANHVVSVLSQTTSLVSGATETTDTERVVD